MNNEHRESVYLRNNPHNNRKVEFPVPIPLAHVMKHAIGCIQDAVTLRRMSTIGILLYIYTSVKLTDVIIVGNIFSSTMVYPE